MGANSIVIQDSGLKGSHGAIGGSKEEDAESEKLISLAEMLDFRVDGVSLNKLSCVEPEKWKNVGVSIVQAFKILKE